MAAIHRTAPAVHGITPSPRSLPTAESENWRLLKFFNSYRLAVATAGCAIGFGLSSLPPFGSMSPELFRVVSVVYLLLAAAAIETLRRRVPDFDSQATFLTFADIALLTLLIHASGGLSSGLGLLLLVAVASSSLMLGKRTTVFFASLASVAALLQHSWGLLTGSANGQNDIMQGYPQVGLLGLGLFATAVLGYTLATRLRVSEALAERRGVHIANLTHVNDLIIQRMQSGVLACGGGGEVLFINQAAQKFFGLRAPAPKKSMLSDLAPDLAIQLFQWYGANPAARTRKLVTTRANYTLLPRFVAIGRGPKAGTLVFLEDMAILKQQAQQLKISALARLTASIAHEIRNPLGAISNAAQLLGESVAVDGEQQRLTKIIDEQSRRMNVIVQNVTQLSRRDRVNPMRLPLGAWIADFIVQYCDTVRIPREVFTRVGATNVDVYVDPDQLSQVITNLCQNGLRHSPPFTGTALIKFQLGHDGDQRPCLDVIDWGSGVAPGIVDNIFDPFFTTSPTGTGLGLYIARELCDGNGATLDYFPGEAGVGSRFRVIFARPDDGADMP